MPDSSELIRHIRQQSNNAIAARDADRVVSYMTEHVVVVVANGPTLVGRESSRKAFVDQFRDPDFGGYTRTAEGVETDSGGTRAVERGTWTGRWKPKIGERDMSGTYTAEWVLTDLGWLIQREEFRSPFTSRLPRT